MTATQPAGPGALGRFRICDFTGQLAGAGATKWLAAFGAEVIRIEDPVKLGGEDISSITRLRTAGEISFFFRISATLLTSIFGMVFGRLRGTNGHE